MSKILHLALATLLALSLSALALGQSQASTGQITGVVTDSNGAVVPSATVTVKNKGTGQEQTASSNDSGVYTFVLLQPGTYTVSAKSANFSDTTIDNIVINVGRSVDVNITLGVGKVAAEVTVTTDSIQATSNISDAVVNESAIANTPILGRRFQDFVTLTPGAQVDPQRGQISLSGQRGINTNVSVDGTDYNQPFFGGIRGGERSNSAFTIPQESIKEFQVIAAGYSAEFGRSSGGIVNAVTKSGDNQIRGSACYLLRHKEFARKNEYITALETDRNISVIAAPTLQQFGGSLGGPLKQNKLFYFLAYEQQRFRAARQVLFGALNTLGSVRSPADPGNNRIAANQEAFDLFRSLETSFQQTNDAYAGLGRLDWQINNSNRFNIRFNNSQNKAINGNSTGEDVLDPTTNRSLSNNGTERNRNNIGVAQLVSNFGTKVVNEFRFQFAREDRPRLANDTSPNVGSGIGNYGVRNFLPTTQFDKRTQFANGLTFIAGNHTMKFGMEFSNIFANQLFGFNQSGVYNPGGGSNDVQAQVLSLTPGNIMDRRFDVAGASYLRQIGNLQAAYTVRELSFFGQDAWRVKSNVTLNYGLRFEKQFNPSPELGNTDLINLLRSGSFPLRGGRGADPTQIPDSEWQVGPRLGFAWDVFKDGKTVVRGFSGLYYARTPLLILAAPFNNFRSPAGDLSVRLPFTVATAFNPANLASLNSILTANPQYAATLTASNPTGVSCVAPITTSAAFAACNPTTIYRQFLLGGINLNSFGLASLPNVTPAQINTIVGRLGVTTNPSVVGVQPIAVDENFRNPRSFQFGGAIERELMPNVVVGIDFSYVNTERLQRNRDINLPSPVNLFEFIQANNSAAVVATLDPSIFAANRPYIGITRISTNIVPSTVSIPTRLRPVASLGSVQLRESSSRSRYQSLTFRGRATRKYGIFNAYLTVSKSLSDDDNERDAGGTGYDNSFDLRSEYGPSRLDRRVQFVANPIVFLPFGFEVASAMRLRSGLPIDTIANADLNGDNVFNDRPFRVPGVPFTRNFFRNKAVYDFDVRIQKGFKIGERSKLSFTTEIFNIFNYRNIQLAGSNVTQYCATTNTPAANRCGLDGIGNRNFLQVREQNTTSSRLGLLLLNNNLGSRPFQVQLGARLQF